MSLLGDMSMIGPRPQAPRCFDAFPVGVQDVIVQIKPGLSGIGPIVFRGEEEILEGNNGMLDFYDNIIGPYKGNVEAWYVGKDSLCSYFSLILLTVWVVVFPKSDIVWRLYKDLPIPPLYFEERLEISLLVGGIIGLSTSNGLSSS